MGEEEKKGVERNKNKWEISFYRKMPASNCKIRKPSNAIIDSGKDHSRMLKTKLQGITPQITYYLGDVMVHVQVRKEFSDMRQNERRIKFIRVGDAVRTIGQLKGELKTFTDLQPTFIASGQRKFLLEWWHYVTG